MSILHKDIITSNLLYKRDAINFLGKSLRRSIMKCNLCIFYKDNQGKQCILKSIMQHECNIHIQNSKFNLFSLCNIF